MIEFGGVFYYIDLDALDKTITPKGSKPTDMVTLYEKKEVFNPDGSKAGVELNETKSTKGKEIDGPKYDVIRIMIDVLIDYDDEMDTTMGSDRALEKLPLSVKLAFNTLYNYGVLKEKE